MTTVNSQQMPGNSTYYRDRYRLVVKVLCVFSVTALTLASALVYLSVRKQEVKYFATQTNGEIVALKPLSLPVVSDDYVLQWTGLVLRQAFNLSFVNWQDQVNAVMSNFTASGNTSFNAALKSSGILSGLKDNKLIISAIVSDTPVIVEKGILASQYYWKVEVPVLLTYNGASDEQQQRVVLRVVIVRVPTIDNAKGIAISSLNPADQIKLF